MIAERQPTILSDAWIIGGPAFLEQNMSISLYDASVPIYRRMLGNLDACLAKAEDNARGRGFEPGVLLDARLAPDMLPMRRQVQIACDAAKYGIARISGTDAPKHEDNETTFAELHARIAQTLAFIDGVPRERIDGQEAREVKVPLRDRTLQFDALSFLTGWSLPNFFFHVTTAYALLRHNGVDLGKQDYLGANR